jgi:hypothetical protein
MLSSLAHVLNRRTQQIFAKQAHTRYTSNHTQARVPSLELSKHQDSLLK